jgi:hypothetical protein
MTPEQRNALPEALRFQLNVAEAQDLDPTVEVARVIEAADGSSNWLVLGCYVERGVEGGSEVTLRTAVAPSGRISRTERVVAVYAPVPSS